jgi:two-component sensor histidine kinase
MTIIGSISSFPNIKDIQSVYIPDDLILNTLGHNLMFLSDFIPADIHLYKLLDNSTLKTIFEAKPSIYPSFYRRTHINNTFPFKENSIFYKVIENKHICEGVQGELFNGLPIYQIAYPIFNKKNKIIGILLIERSFNEKNRWGLKDWLYNTIINNIINSVLENSLVDTRSLPSIYPGDGIIVIDSNGIINYSNYPAINILQFIGLSTPLEGDKFEEVFSIGSWRLIELNSLYGEQELDINKHVINVKSIPLNNFILIIIRDISELRHKDQEIKIKSTIIKEIHHRVKNNLQSIVSLLRLQRRRIDNPEMKDIINDSISRINSIAVVHDYLSQKNVDVIDLTEMSKNIFFEVTSSVTLPDKKITFKVESPENLLFSSVKAVSVALVLNEMLNNTLKHAFVNISEGSVELKLEVRDDILIISVLDNGIGLPKDFNPNKNGNLGWKIIRTLVKDDLKGNWFITSEKGRTIVSIEIPFNYV